jgi:hypothetical protein
VLEGHVSELTTPQFAGSHCTWNVCVERVGSQTPPSGIGPSPTESVTVTVPAAEQVKLVLAEFGAEKEPLGADQAYVSAAAFAALAVAAKLTLPPTVVSDGLSLALATEAQS